MKRYNLSEIMKEAHRFLSITGKSFSECLKKAWQNAKLVLRLRMQIVHFYFTKVNGEVREAWGTLKQEVIPTPKGSERSKPDTLQVYFDTEKQEYRSFKKLNLLSFE